MVSTLYTLKKEYREKKIYILDIDRDAICRFTKASFSRINIQGFITLQEEYVGETYINRPVLALSQIEGNEENIILVSEEISKDKLKQLPEKQVRYWVDLIGLDDTLHEKKIIIYGTGYGADQICKELVENNIEISLYCVTKIDGNDQYKGKKIIEASELHSYMDYAIIISVQNISYRREILDTLSGFQGMVYVDLEYIISATLPLISPMQSIDFALKHERKIFIYNKKIGLITGLIEDILNMYGISVSGYVYEIEDKKQKIENIYELAYEGVDDKLVIINELFLEQLIKARECLETAGFSLEKLNYTGFLNYTRAKERMLAEWEEYKDPLVGFNILYPDGKPGWKVYGQEEEDRIRVIVLGGSTSSEEYFMENWVSKLYYKLKKNNIQTVIYNGAHIDNDIVDEMLRLLRDGNVLRPQIVISMSGVNNLHYKETPNQFNEERLLGWVKAMSCDQNYYSGVPDNESLYSFWSRNEKLLKLIAEFYGAVFFGFLQPINIVMQNKTLWEKSFFERERHAPGAREFLQCVNDESDYINLMNLLEHQEGMYFDMCHYTNQGHEMIADYVYETILPTMQLLKEENLC